MAKTISLLKAHSGIPLVAAVGFLLLTLLTAGRYGFYGDELYYVACSKNLDFGYVDHPPLVAFLGLLSRQFFGETLIGLRFLSGLAGAGTVLLSALLTRKLGGGTFAQSVAALSISFAVAFPALSSFFSMNPVDITLVTAFLVLFLETIEKPTPLRWISLGIVLGIGLLNKYTFLVLGFSLLVSLVVTKQWSLLKMPWLYVSGLIGVLMFAPHVLWQINHDWPTLEFMRNATQYKNLSLSLVELSGQLVLGLNPLTLPLWTAGLIGLLLYGPLKPFRFLGWTVTVYLVVYMTQNSKFYYLLPAFPVLLSTGAILFERFAQRFSRRWIRWAMFSPVAISGLMLMPLAVPLLPPGRFISYSKTLGLWDAIRMEKSEGDTLPLHFVFRFGWEELVEVIADSYHALPPKDREKCAILASWYGPAGAVDHFGARHGLPESICPRNNYWLWGPREYSGSVVIAVGYDTQILERYFEDVELVATFTHAYAIDQPIHVCRILKRPMDQIWPSIKVFS
jgi:hypothetical protein